MKSNKTVVRLSAIFLLAACGLSDLSYAGAASRVNPAFINYNTTVSSSAFRTMAAGKTSAGAAASVSRGLGWRPSPVNMEHMAGRDVSAVISRKSVGVLAAPRTGSYPSSYSLVTAGKVTPVKNQGYYGTCWTFAANASLESNLMPASPVPDFSENNMAMNSGFDGDPMNQGGNSSMAAAYLSSWAGPVNESDDPYPTYPTEVTRTGKPVQKHLQEMYWLPPALSANETAFKNNVKAAITSNGAAFASLYWDYAALSGSSYYDAHCDAPYGSGGSCTCVDTADGCSGHAIALVGWDDAYTAANFPGPGAFIAKNSWGTSFGSAGYFYISYSDTSIGGETAVFNVAESTTNYNTVYQYDPLGYVYTLGNSDVNGSASATEWMANIFTASSTGFIKAAGFYTTDIGVSYEMYVYTNITAGSPRSGTLAYSTAGSFPLSGYHTVTIPSVVPISTGQLFSIVVRLANTTSNYPIPVEIRSTDLGSGNDYSYSSGANASPGQSYYSLLGTSWTDLTTLTNSYNYGDNFSHANVCLKAYAFTDSTPPTTIAAVNDGTGADISLTGSATTLSANWTASSDPESGVSAYYYAIGTAPNLTDITGWTSVGTSLTVTKTGLSLLNGNTYYFGVKALNGAGLYSAVTWSNGQTVNINFPTDIPYVYDGQGSDVNYVSSLHTLSANWAPSSFPSGTIDHYYYAIGTTPGGQQTTVWTDLGPGVYSVTKTGLALTEGQVYYFSVKAVNNYGNASNIAASDGQTVDITSPTVSLAVNGPVPVPNGAFSVGLTVTEAGALASAPSLSFTAPDGELVPLVVTGGGTSWQANGFMESYYSTGTATLHFSAVDGAGNTGSFINSGGTFLIDQSVSGVTGGTVSNSDGDSVVIPAGASGSALYVTISTLPVSREATADASSYDSIKIRSVDLSREFKAHNAAGAPITDFSLHPLTITLAYPDVDNDGRIDGDFIKENLAWLYYMDEVAGKWTPLPGVVRHPAGNTLSAEVPHFSVYSVRASAASDQGLAGLKAYPNPCDLRKVPAGLVIAGIPVDAVSPAVYIYNEAGELVRTLLPGDGIDGINTAHWDGKTKGGAKAASGLYMYLVRTSNYGKGSGKFFIVW